MTPFEKLIKEKRYKDVLPPPSESEVQKAILEYLVLRGYFCWRNNTGAFNGEYKGKKRFFRYGLPGSGDILGMTKEGRFFSIEVKARGKEPTDTQWGFMKRVADNKGLSILAYDVSDVERYL